MKQQNQTLKTGTDELGDWEKSASAHAAEIERLSELRTTEREGLRTAQCEIARLKHGVEAGTIVKYRNVLHRVTGVDARYGKPWVTGNPMRKDGTYGTAERNLYSDWELVS